MCATRIQSCLRGYWLRERLKQARNERLEQLQREKEEMEEELEARRRRHQSSYGSPAALSGHAARRRKRPKKRKKSVAGLPLNYLGLWGNSQGGSGALKSQFSKRRGHEETVCSHCKQYPGAVVEGVHLRSQATFSSFIKGVFSIFPVAAALSLFLSRESELHTMKSARIMRRPPRPCPRVTVLPFTK